MSTFSQMELSVVGPSGWDEHEDVLGAVVAFVSPDRGDGSFRPNLNVVLQPLADETPLAAVVAAHAAELESALRFPRVIDAGMTQVGGQAASRVLVAYSDNDEDLSLEQWIVPFPGRAVVISGTCRNVDYAVFTPVFDEIVATVAFADA